jgi:hypothetical protein
VSSRSRSSYPHSETAFHRTDDAEGDRAPTQPVIPLRTRLAALHLEYQSIRPNPSTALSRQVSNSRHDGVDGPDSSRRLSPVASNAFHATVTGDAATTGLQQMEDAPFTPASFGLAEPATVRHDFTIETRRPELNRSSPDKGDRVDQIFGRARAATPFHHQSGPSPASRNPVTNPAIGGRPPHLLAERYGTLDPLGTGR